MPNAPFCTPALIFVVLAIPLICRLVPRNRFYGIRTTGTLGDDENWYRANQFGSLCFAVASLAYLAFAYVAPYDGRDLKTVGEHFCAFFIPLAVAAKLTAGFIRKVGRS